MDFVPQDEFECVTCGASEYKDMRGKAPRKFKALCPKCYNERKVAHDAKKANEQKAK